MSITINGQTSPAAEFAWDGCHKIYLLDNGDADKNGKYGYMLSKNGEAGYKVLPVSELQRVWDQSCPLRFINNWALDKNMFPNATRSPSPSKRVERENHEIIQGIRGRIRSGYRSHPMGVQPPFCREGAPAFRRGEESRPSYSHIIRKCGRISLMSQKVVLERVTLDGAKPFTGHADRHDPESERLYARSGGQAMDWLCDAWRYRFNQLRSNRCKYGKDKTLVPIGGEPDTRSVSQSRSECSWLAAVPSLILESPTRIERVEWFTAVQRCKTLLSKRLKPGRMPRFKSYKRDGQRFVCWHNGGRNAVYRRVNRNHGIITITGQNPKGMSLPGEPLRYRILLHVRVSQPIREYTAIQVDWTNRTVVFNNTPTPIKHEPTGRAVGIDRGCVHAAADSDGRFMDLPKDRLKAIDREIRKRQKAQARRAGNAGYSSEREYAKSGKTSRAYRRTRLEIGRLHAKSKRILDDVYQKYTTRLVRENDLIVLENLRLANMSRRNKPVPDPLHEGRYLPNGQDAKHGLNRSLRQASMGRLASMLAYKTKLAEGVGMILVNPAYTSQTCSRCGHVDKKNRESQAVFVCKKCSYTANADVNAARNILERGLDTLAVTSGNLWGADGTPVEQGHKTNGNAARESVAVS